jgi:hypothetical protein
MKNIAKVNQEKMVSWLKNSDWSTLSLVIRKIVNNGQKWALSTRIAVKGSVLYQSLFRYPKIIYYVMLVPKIQLTSC